MSQPIRVAGFELIISGRFWMIAEETTTLSVVHSATEWHGYAVEGFAPPSRAARQLGEEGIGSRTLLGFLAHVPNAATQEQRHFYFVDESIQHNALRKSLDRARGGAVTAYRWAGVESSLRVLAAFEAQWCVAHPPKCGSIVPLVQLGS